MNFLIELFLNSINILILTVGGFLIIFFSKKLTKRTSRLMSFNLILTFVLSCSVFAEGYVADHFLELPSFINGDILRTILTILNYTLYPTTTCLLFLITLKENKRNYLFFIPIVISLILSSTSFFTSKVCFSIADNKFIESDIFVTRFFPHLVSIVYGLVLFIRTFLLYKDLKPFEGIILTFTVISVFLSAIIQFANEDILCVPLSIGIAILFYYAFLTMQYIRKHDNALVKLAKIDRLTGLFNDNAYIETCEQFETYKKPYGVIMVDLNNIKATNDKYGHRFGAHLIRRAGQTINQIFRKSYCFHIGGDEFAIFVIEDDYKNIKSLLKKLEENLSYQKIKFEGKNILLSAAFGYAKYEKNVPLKKIISKADKAMYKNKKTMKDKYNLSR